MSNVEAEHVSPADSLRYRVIRMVDRRGPVVVCLGQDTCTNERVVMKLYPRKDINRDKAERELLEHKGLLHRHLVRFRDVFVTRRYLAVVMDYVEGGSLRDCLLRRRRVPEDFARCVFQQLILALDYCRRMGLGSLDIKVRSLLLMDDSPWPLVKLSAFGHTSRIVSDPSMKPNVRCVLRYMAPEMLHLSGGSRSREKSDIWRCGVVLFCMLVGRHPFDRPDSDKDIRTLVESIVAARYSIPRGLMSAECEDMIQRLLVADPKRRASLQEIQSHPWYKIMLPEAAIQLSRELHAETNVRSE